MKPLRAAGLLGLGKGGQVVFTLLALALAARTLGVEAFGTLVLIHALIVAITKTASFQTWQALIHYGAKAQEKSDEPHLKRIIQFSALIDILTAFFAFAIVWVVSILAMNLVGLDESLSETLRLYGSVILFMVLNGAPSGILQLYDRFDRIAWHTAIAPFIRGLGCIYLFLTQASMIEFLVLWYISEMIAALVLITMALCTLKEKNVLSGLLNPAPSLLNPEKGIWRYVIGTQAASTLDLSGTHLPVLFVGGVLGPSAAGLFRIAQEFASVLLKSGAKLFGRAIYSDLARLSAQNDIAARRHMMGRTAFVIGALAIAVFAIFVLFGKQAIILSAGEDFIGAYETMLWLCFAGVIALTGFALEPMLISAGHIRQTVIARTIATVIFIPILYLLLTHSGIIGAGIAMTIYMVLITVFMLIAGRKLLNKTDPQ